MNKKPPTVIKKDLVCHLYEIPLPPPFSKWAVDLSPEAVSKSLDEEFKELADVTKVCSVNNSAEIMSLALRELVKDKQPPSAKINLESADKVETLRQVLSKYNYFPKTGQDKTSEDNNKKLKQKIDSLVSTNECCRHVWNEYERTVLIIGDIEQ